MVLLPLRKSLPIVHEWWLTEAQKLDRTVGTTAVPKQHVAVKVVGQTPIVVEAVENSMEKRLMSEGEGEGERAGEEAAGKVQVTARRGPERKRVTVRLWRRLGEEKAVVAPLTVTQN
jgi:hypothetical protein